MPAKPATIVMSMLARSFVVVIHHCQRYRHLQTRGPQSLTVTGVGNIPQRSQRSRGHGENYRVATLMLRGTEKSWRRWWEW